MSGLNAANTVSTLSTDADVDFYKFTVTGVSRLLADLWSENLYLNSFDGMLRLYDTDGTTVLASFDNTTYNGNAFNNGTHQGFDPSLLNISLPGAGTYFLEVSSVGNHDASSGGAYNLVFGVAAAAIPEAQAWLALSVVSAVVVGAKASRGGGSRAGNVESAQRTGERSSPAIFFSDRRSATPIPAGSLGRSFLVLC